MQEAGLLKCVNALVASMQLNVRPHFANSNRDDASALHNASGLPYSDDQKKWRLRSHLSA